MIMSLKSILFAGAAALSLLSPALATSAYADDYYSCNDRACYDNQAEETRELNLMQLEHPGAGVYAVPGYRGPGYRDDGDEDDRYGDDESDRDERGDGYGYRDRDDERYGGGVDSGGYRGREYDDDRYGDTGDDEDRDNDDNDDDDDR
jgi:hypothetical protein